MNFPDYPFTPQRFEVRPGNTISYLDDGAKTYDGDAHRVAFLFCRYAELTSLV